MYSTIKKKLCKCGCGKPPTISFSGFNYLCAPDEIKEKVLNKRLKQKKESAKRQLDKSKVRSLINSKDDERLKKQHELNEWFKDKIKRMTGRCENCGGATTKGNKKYERFSIAHILFKSKVKSVATHDKNWIELCYFGNSCHSNLDNCILEYQDLKCWDKVQNRFELMYPSIDKSEYQFIPDVLMQSLSITEKL